MLFGFEPSDGKGTTIFIEILTQFAPLDGGLTVSKLF